MIDKTKYYNSITWKNKRNLVIDRDNNKCVLCGSENDLHVHHLTYERFGDENL